MERVSLDVWSGLFVASLGFERFGEEHLFALIASDNYHLTREKSPHQPDCADLENQKG